MPTRAADNALVPPGHWDESPWVDADGVYLVKGLYWQGPNASGTLMMLWHSVVVRKEREGEAADAFERARAEGLRLLEAKVAATCQREVVCPL